MIKSIRVALIAALTAFTLIGSSVATAQSPVLNRVVKSGKLRASLCLSFYPFLPLPEFLPLLATM